MYLHVSSFTASLKVPGRLFPRHATSPHVMASAMQCWGIFQVDVAARSLSCESCDHESSRLAGKQRRKFSSLETLIERINNMTGREGGGNSAWHLGSTTGLISINNVTQRSIISNTICRFTPCILKFLRSANDGCSIAKTNISIS